MFKAFAGAGLALKRGPGAFGFLSPDVTGLDPGRSTGKKPGSPLVRGRAEMKGARARPSP